MLKFNSFKKLCKIKKFAQQKNAKVASGPHPLRRHQTQPATVTSLSWVMRHRPL